jgi:NAD-dependent DNA ligase
MGRSGQTTRKAAIARGVDLRALVRGSRIPPEMAQQLSNDWRKTEEVVARAAQAARLGEFPLNGMVFVITGDFRRVKPEWHPRQKLIQKLIALGAVATESGSKVNPARGRAADGVIVGDLTRWGGSSDKTRKAINAGIPLVMIDDVIQLLRGDRSAVHAT